MTTTQHAEPTSPGTAMPIRPPAGIRPQRVLVAWFRFRLRGGISMFINIARVLGRFGHTVEFVSLSGETQSDWPDFPGRILTLDEARRETWDAVMVPGAGEPAARLEELAVFKEPRFGRRVQHVLSDTSVLDGFQVVNRAFEPDLLLINNSSWQPRDFRIFDAGSFHLLPGAVDTELFYPAPLKSIPGTPPVWSIGVCSSRCLEPIRDAIALLPDDTCLHLYGELPPEHADWARIAARTGRVELHGQLSWQELAEFYRAMDLVVAVQDRAGWCGPAAEPMACGVPCIVGERGTTDFARHLENAFVLDAPSGRAIASAIRELRDDPERLRRLARSAAATMRAWSWTSYCAELLAILTAPPRSAYFRLPALGLPGKWEPEVRLTGLEPLVSQCSGRTVLDLGCAEGVIGWLFGQSGARLIHGIERVESRVRFAREALAPRTETTCAFFTADLADWNGATDALGDHLLDLYDIVLCLDLYDRLPAASRRATLIGAAGRSRQWFALRLPEPLVERDGIVTTLAAQGFRLAEMTPASPELGLDWLGLFERTAPFTRTGESDHTAWREIP